MQETPLEHALTAVRIAQELANDTGKTMYIAPALDGYTVTRGPVSFYYEKLNPAKQKYEDVMYD